MTTEAIIERIRQKDWTIVEEEGAIGPEAAEAIRRLLRDRDHEVRELAVHGLGIAGGGSGRAGIIDALRNDSEMARSAASHVLLTQPHPEYLPELVLEIGTNQDEFVREHVALVLGMIGDDSTVELLKRVLIKEVDPSARHAMELALARLNDPAHREKYLLKLQQGEPAERARAAQDFAYVGDRSLLPELLPLLDDTRDAINVGPSNVKHYIRVCDVTVNMLDAMLGHPFSFQTGRRIRYSPEELDEARRLVQKR